MRRAFAHFWRKAYEDNVTGMAAMVAYNLILSVFPLALVALFVAGRILASEDIEASVVEDLQRLFPSQAESTLLDGLHRVQDSSTTVGILAVVAATWFSSSFWGALDTAFCRIYHRECRSWVRQKLFALGMLAVVLLFFVASVTIPALQGLVVGHRDDLPFGLGEVRGFVYGLSLAGGLVLLFGILCLVYWRVPRGSIPWRCVWPGALLALVGMAVVDVGFPLYLTNVTSLRVGTSFLFVLIVLVWFYVLALILLAGAVVNELRFEQRWPPGQVAGYVASMADPKTEELRVEEHQHERRAERAEPEARGARRIRGTGRGRRMTEDHRQQAEAAERELADMEERSERVGEHIDEARKDWKAKVADPSVPGATGDTDDGDGELPPPDPTETD
jgi:YihY family inner membrane protein